ncbi:MAG: Ig-like domain-containing protein, partial [Planctomycetota bacterium]
YALNGGDSVYMRGSDAAHQKATLDHNDSGSAVHALENVSVTGSVVTFSTTPAGVSTTTDYVYLYNSFRGNSGAFKISGVAGAAITVDTSEHPGTTFVTEATADSPWGLQAAIIRPVRIIGCHADGTPRGDYATLTGSDIGLQLIGSDYIYASYLYLNAQTDKNLSIGGTETYGNDYVAIDNFKMDSAGRFAIQFCGHEYSSQTCDSPCVGDNTAKEGTDQDYNIFQHMDVSDSGKDDACLSNLATGEMLYHGCFYGRTCDPTDSSTWHFTRNNQIMYNYFHDGFSCENSRSDPEAIDGRANNRYTMIWGNYFYNNDQCKYDNLVRFPGGEFVVANNYFESNDPKLGGVCGGGNTLGGWEVITDTGCDGGGLDYSDGCGGSACTNYIFNNIFDRNKTKTAVQDSPHGNIGVYKISGGTWHIYNNTFYGPDKESGVAAITLKDAGASPSATLTNVYNNIIQNFQTGLDGEDGTITNDANNILYDNTDNCQGGETCFSDQSLFNIDPGLTNPATGDFTISVGDNAHGVGTDLSAYFQVDNHDAADPTLTSITQPIERTGSWDVGAYEVGGATFSVSSILPADDSVDVDVSEIILMGCSENLDSSTVIPANIYVVCGGTTQDRRLSMPADDKVNLNMKDSVLPAATNCTVTATTDVSASGGATLVAFSSSFTTETSHANALTVSDVEPDNEATGVLTTITPYVQFAEDLNPSTIAGNITLSNGGAVTVRLSQTANNRVVLTPASELSPNTTYTITVTILLEDVFGNVLASQWTSTFTTAP